MMQILMKPLDPTLVQTADAVARTLLMHIGSERERVSALIDQRRAQRTRRQPKFEAVSERYHQS
jgi:hypothetical protein